jgi:hypothetical protein
MFTTLPDDPWLNFCSLAKDGLRNVPPWTLGYFTPTNTQHMAIFVRQKVGRGMGTLV